MNGIRGEVSLEAGGRTLRLCLTLGALAEIETALGVSSLAQLEERLTRLSTVDLVALTLALARGGGETLTREELMGLPVTVPALVGAVSAAFSAAQASLDDPQARERHV